MTDVAKLCAEQRIVIDNFEETVQKLKSLEVLFLLKPTQTDFGFMTIITDPDEGKIELYKK